MGLRPKPHQRTNVLWTPICFYKKTRRSPEDASPLVGFGAKPHNAKIKFLLERASNE